MQDNDWDVINNETDGISEESEGMVTGDDVGAEGTPEDGVTGDGSGDAEDGVMSEENESAEWENGDELLDNSVSDDFLENSYDGDTGMVDGGFVSDDMYGDMGLSDMGTETAVKDPILSNVPFVAVTITAALLVGILLGILLGKKRIKKGFDSYED